MASFYKIWTVSNESACEYRPVDSAVFIADSEDCSSLPRHDMVKDATFKKIATVKCTIDRQKCCTRVDRPPIFPDNAMPSRNKTLECLKYRPAVKMVPPTG